MTNVTTLIEFIDQLQLMRQSGMEHNTYHLTLIPNLQKSSTVVCKLCQTPLFCLNICSAKIYYILSPPPISRACVHIGTHSHHVKIGDDREAKERLTTFFSEQVERTPFATNSAIVLEAGKEFVIL